MGKKQFIDWLKYKNLNFSLVKSLRFRKEISSKNLLKLYLIFLFWFVIGVLFLAIFYLTDMVKNFKVLALLFVGYILLTKKDIRDIARYFLAEYLFEQKGETYKEYEADPFEYGSEFL